MHNTLGWLEDESYFLKRLVALGWEGRHPPPIFWPLKTYQQSFSADYFQLKKAGKIRIGNQRPESEELTRGLYYNFLGTIVL